MDTGIRSVARLTEAKVRAVLAAADAAPTSPGGGPWQFICTPTAFELYTTRPDDPVATLACGAALLNLRLAIHDLGVHANVRLTPDPTSRPTLLATVRPDNERPGTTRERQMVMVLTGPAPTRSDPVTPDTAVQELRRAADLEHAWLAALSGAELGIGDGGLYVVIGSLHDDVTALLWAGQAIQRVVLTAGVLGLDPKVVPGPLATREARANVRSRIGGALTPHAVVRISAG
jgi:hypothetical protein